LKPHAKGLAIGTVAALVESAANLAEPWPLKIVLDHVLRSKPGHGWLNQVISSIAGADKVAVLKFAALAVVAISAVGATANYTQRCVTTGLGQWITYDLRQTLYFHIQRLSLSYHDRKQTGDLISRLTSDIDAIQSFVASGLLGALINSLTLMGMMVVMFCLSRQFTLIALSVAPLLFAVVFHYTRRIKTSFARSAEKGRRDSLGNPGDVVVHARGEGLCTRRIRTTSPGRREP
jgi:subfamily B ATP-binding cassette protein MsbA